MKQLVNRSRLGAIAVVAMLAVAACASDDGAPAANGSGDDTTSVSTPDNGDATTVAPAPGSAAVLEVSASLDVVGDALTPLEDPSLDPAVGVAAPVVIGQQFDGTDITIGGATDGPTMLVFLAHWCSHCNAEIPELVKIRDAGGFPDGLDIIGISTAVADDRENYPPSNWMVEKDFTWPVLADTIDADAFQTFGGTGFPYTVMLDADGNVTARKSGSESAAKITEWIEAALAG